MFSKHLKDTSVFPKIQVPKNISPFSYVLSLSEIDKFVNFRKCDLNCNWMLCIRWKRRLFESDNIIFFQVYARKIRIYKSSFYCLSTCSWRQKCCTINLQKIWKGKVISSLSPLMTSITVVSQMFHMCVLWDDEILSLLNISIIICYWLVKNTRRKKCWFNSSSVRHTWAV